jgi:hypothetical protein
MRSSRNRSDWSNTAGSRLAAATATTTLSPQRMSTPALEDKVSRALMGPVTEDPSVRAALARAAALIGSTRSYVYDTLGGLYATVQAGDKPSFDQRAQWAGCVVHGNDMPGRRPDPRRRRGFGFPAAFLSAGPTATRRQHDCPAWFGQPPGLATVSIGLSSVF